MEQLSALDAAFIYLESTRTPMHIGGLYLIDAKDAGGLSYEALRAHVASRLPLARPFRQRLVEVPLAMGHPYWVEDPDFDLHLHLPHLGVPRPGGKAELMRLAADLFARPLSRSRPLWEMAFVDGVDNYPGMSPGSYAIIARVHHAAVDGISGAEIMGALVDPTPSGGREIAPDSWRPEKLPKGVELVAKSYGKLGSKSIDLAKTLGRTLSGAGSLVRRTLEETRERPPIPSRAPRTPFNARVGPHRPFGGIQMPRTPAAASRRSAGGFRERPSTTSCWRSAPGPCGSGSRPATRCPTSRWWRWCRCRCAPRTRRRRWATWSAPFWSSWPAMSTIRTNG